MIEQRRGAVVTMVVLAALLAVIGVWQFGNLGLGGSGERESEDEYEHNEHITQHREITISSGELRTMLERIAAEENAHIIEVEHESEHGRDIYELKLVGPGGRLRELKVDTETGEVRGRE